MGASASLKRKYRENNLRRYRMSQDDYNRMYYGQDGLCKICRLPETQGPFNQWGYKPLSVDHEHGTHPPKVRGLLCHRCNKVLGMVRDNKDLLYAMARYVSH